MKLVEVAVKALGLAFVLLLALFALRGCAVSSWVSGEEPVFYYGVSEDRRVFGVLVLPENKVIIWYSDPETGEKELALAWWRGTFGDHYGLGIWSFDEVAPVPGPNWRLFPREFEPVFMEVKVLEKHLEGTNDSGFPEEGSTEHQFVLLSRDRSKIHFAGRELDRTEIDGTLVAHFRSLVRDPQVRQVLTSVASGATAYDPLLALENGFLPKTEEEMRAFLAVIVAEWTRLGRESDQECDDPNGQCFEVYSVEIRPTGLGITRHLRLTRHLEPEKLGALSRLLAPGWNELEDFCVEPTLSMMAEFDVRIESYFYPKNSDEPFLQNEIGIQECNEFLEQFD